MTITERSDLAEQLVAALAAQDVDRLERCFAPNVRFYAAVPSEARPLRELTGAREVAEQLGAWFGDGDPLELVDSQHEWVADRLRLSYRFRSCEDGAWHLVEQQAFCEVGEAGIEQMRLVCSGFRPL
jgi:SnoaL-like domain